MTQSSEGRITFEATFGKPGQKQSRPASPVFSVLVLADFSGRAGTPTPSQLGTRKPRRVNIDNLDQVLGGFGATLKVSPTELSGAAVTLSFQSLDDFHPDSLLQRVPILSDLLAAKQGLLKTGSTTEAAEKLAGMLGVSEQPQSGSSVEGARENSSQATPGESDGQTLERLLGHAKPTTPSTPKGNALGSVDKLIREAVQSSGAITPAPSSASEGLISAADLELTARLRGLLHDPVFQSLEAAWRGLDFLVRRCPDEERIQFSVLDVTLDELAGDLEAFKRIVRDAPPQLLLGHYTFGQTKADLAALQDLATLSSELGVRFLAGAHPRLAGCDSFWLHPDPSDWRAPLSPDLVEAWSGVRASRAAAQVSLAAPRFLLRQPYGRTSEPIERFAFEEIRAATEHESFLWGNAAFACAQVLVEAFVAEAEGMDVGGGGEVDDLPVFRYKDDEGESAMKPCAEAWLVDRAAEALLQRGVTPLLSIKGRNAIRVATFASIAKRA